jgi:hypothetical protein
MKPEPWSTPLHAGDNYQEKEPRSLETGKVNFKLEQSTKTQRRSRFIATLFL